MTKLRPTALSDQPRDRLETMLSEAAREIARLKKVVKLQERRWQAAHGRPANVTLH